MATPAIGFIGRSGSGKTTLTVKVIAELCARGHRVGSVKHHGHKGFDIDVPGKDSWRQTQAGSVHTVIASPDKVATIRQLERELEFGDILATMDDVEIVVVEGYRHSGIPSIELFRKDNPKDADPANDDEARLRAAVELGDAVAVATDNEETASVARGLGLPVFSLDDVSPIVDFIESRIL